MSSVKTTPFVDGQQSMRFTEDCVFYEPRGSYRGRDEIHRIAGIKAAHPDFRYQPTVPPEELGNAGRVQWVSGRPGEAPEYAGTDFIIARDGRIAALYLFRRAILNWTSQVVERPPLFLVPCVKKIGFLSFGHGHQRHTPTSGRRPMPFCSRSSSR